MSLTPTLPLKNPSFSRPPSAWRCQKKNLIATLLSVSAFLLGSASAGLGAQTMTGVTFVKLVRDPANQNVLDLVIALDLKNDKHSPITATKDQFVVMDNQGDTYKPSDSPLPRGVLLQASDGWAALPQQINPRIKITAALFFVVPAELELTDARVCSGKDCIPLGPAAAAMDVKEMERYKSHAVASLLGHWDEPSDLPLGATAYLRAIIRPHGEIDTPTITKSSGYSTLDQSCLDSALQLHKLDPPPVRADFALYFHCSVGSAHPYPFGVDGGQTDSLPDYGIDAIDGIPIEKVGPDVQPPKLVYTVDPKMPADFPRTKGFQAEVVVTLIIDTQGVPQKVGIARSYSAELDQSALEAATQYRFKPAMRKGQPVPVRVNIDVTFRSK
jgi:TonB family protein